MLCLEAFGIVFAVKLVCEIATGVNELNTQNNPH